LLALANWVRSIGLSLKKERRCTHVFCVCDRRAFDEAIQFFIR
jgi:hypothetical protein